MPLACRPSACARWLWINRRSLRQGLARHQGNDAVALAFLGGGLPWAARSLSGMGVLPSWVERESPGAGQAGGVSLPSVKVMVEPGDVLMHVGCEMLTPNTGCGSSARAQPSRAAAWQRSHGNSGKSLPMASRISVYDATVSLSRLTTVLTTPSLKPTLNLPSWFPPAAKDMEQVVGMQGARARAVGDAGHGLS